jgi:hypothetical protein
MFFWVIFILWFFFAGYSYWGDPTRRVYLLGGHGLTALLIFLLGWHAFGFVVK